MSKSNKGTFTSNLKGLNRDEQTVQGMLQSINM